MEPRLKTRHPAAVVALSVVSLGIYQYVWYCRVNREMRDFGAARGIARWPSRSRAARPWRSSPAGCS